MGNCIPCCQLTSKPVPERFHYPIITMDGNMTYVEPVYFIPYTYYS